MQKEILNDPDYWLDKALDRVHCGRRNEVGTFLATQLRDNRVPKKRAEDTMKRYAKQVPNCSGDAYTEREALSTLRSVYRTKPRDPATTDSGEGTNQLEERARERESELLEKFKKDPTQLSEKELQRLKYSPVTSKAYLNLLKIEMAKEYMTEEEKEEYNAACSSSNEKKIDKIVRRALQRRSNNI